MEHLSEWQEVWKSAKVDGLPGKAEMIRSVLRYKSRRLRKVWLTTALLFSSVLTIIYVVRFNRSYFITTTIGACMMLTSILPLLVSKIRSLRRMHLYAGLSNSDYLVYLQRVEKARSNYYTKWMPPVFVFYAVGLLLYFYEQVSSHWWLVTIAYVLLLAWLGYCWFFLGPKLFNRDRMERRAMMERLKALSQQMEREME